ncbi:TM2 domain-containing protein [Jimgerdemannia flammicorona]|uniref:TM2 domain-containing protein n=1 Tax=Jimgerdemannia flammicorona TaxID=994334 RepID=A0A433DDA6_9FUNG|nr:TM2 domain-containing protein [Jimgerdemannia flammicorona]
MADYGTVEAGGHVEGGGFFIAIRRHLGHHEHRKRWFAAWIILLSIVAVLVLSYHWSTDILIGAPEEPDRCKSDRSWLAALLFSIFLGPLGVDRFYLGYIFTGILKLVTAGLGGIWWVVDIVLIAAGALPDHYGCYLS